MPAVQLGAGSIRTGWGFVENCKSPSVVEIFFSALYYGEPEFLRATALNCLLKCLEINFTVFIRHKIVIATTDIIGCGYTTATVGYTTATAVDIPLQLLDIPLQLQLG